MTHFLMEFVNLHVQLIIVILVLELVKIVVILAMMDMVGPEVTGVDINVNFVQPVV